MTSDGMIQRDVRLAPGDIEILRYLGKIDMLVDKEVLNELKRDLERRGETYNRALMQWNPLSDVGRATSARVFEARIKPTTTDAGDKGTKCFLKEYLPLGITYGKREAKCTRQLTLRWNEAIKNGSSSHISTCNMFPSPRLLGSLRTDERVEEEKFRQRWAAKFPRVEPPEHGNLWLTFEWDESTFRTFRRFAPLPQVVAGMDYFRKDRRLAKRWAFVRKSMRGALEAVEFLHRTG